MISPITSAGIILSYKCNSRCRHCLYACGREWTDWIDVEDGRRILEGMKKTAPYISGVHFAGGEAFLDFPKLLKLVEVATELRIPIDYVETNAGWCVDEESAREKLMALRQAGLGCLLVSASPFHAEYIPPERTIRLIELAYDVFGAHGVIIWLAEFLREITSIRTDKVIPFDEYVQKCGKYAVSRAAAYGGAMVSGGRAGVRLKDYMQLHPAERFYDARCERELLRSGTGHIDLYGNYIPASCTGIAISDARDLPALLKGFDPKEHPIIDILCSQGLGQLALFAHKRFGFRPAEEGYAGKCHLCVDVRRHIDQNTDEYPELSPRPFYQHL